jgi:hypothetical protein
VYVATREAGGLLAGMMRLSAKFQLSFSYSLVITYIPISHINYKISYLRTHESSPATAKNEAANKSSIDISVE